MAVHTRISVESIQWTPLDWGIKRKDIATADLLRKHGDKTGEELKAERKQPTHATSRWRDCSVTKAEDKVLIDRL
ncbi:hypothetical protein OAF43_00935 [bacterium]|nr:hypothetical protein [bacterium]